MTAPICCPIVELRQYTLKPGMRDVLIELFEREFIETQEAVGITLIGQFRDLDNPDRFVWLRGFPDMPIRAQALEAFYGGPVWKTHREVANATMIDSDNVLLLRPARAESAFSLETTERRSAGSETVPKGLIIATIYHLDASAGGDFIDLFEREIRPELIDAGASVLSYFVTETHPNTFPALPVRENANVFVCFSSFPDQATYQQHATTLANSMRSNSQIANRLSAPAEVLKLLPTPRSRLQG